MNPNTVLWIYIVLLLIGGLIGFFKAGSKISLITSVVSAAVLILTMNHNMLQPAFANTVADLTMLALLIVFTIRLTKTRKFMPSGFMLAVTVAALAFRHFA